MAVGLEDGRDTVPNIPDIPNLTTYLNKLPHVLEYRAEGGCNKEQVAVVMLVMVKTPSPMSLTALPAVLQ